jgi:hypothetical protein
MVKGDIFRADFALQHRDMQYLCMSHQIEASIRSDLLRSAGRYNKVLEVGHMISYPRTTEPPTRNPQSHGYNDALADVERSGRLTVDLQSIIAA